MKSFVRSRAAIMLPAETHLVPSFIHSSADFQSVKPVSRAFLMRKASGSFGGKSIDPSNKFSVCAEFYVF